MEAKTKTISVHLKGPVGMIILVTISLMMKPKEHLKST